MEPLFFKAENDLRASRLLAISVRFNGAAFFQSGKSPMARQCLRRLLMLQWSRFFSKRKITNVLRRVEALEAASMEPLFFKAENYRRNRRTSARAPRASMEPLFFKAENRCPGALPGWTQRGFNGAAFFQSGKSYTLMNGLSSKKFASMEPLFFKAENRQFRLPSSAQTELQWSRFFSKRKILGRTATLLCQCRLQWSRFFSNRKIGG